MSAPWLSGDWFALAVAEADGLSGPPTLEGTVVVEVTGAGDGTVSGHAVFEAGRLVSAGAGPVDERSQPPPRPLRERRRRLRGATCRGGRKRLGRVGGGGGG